MLTFYAVPQIQTELIVAVASSNSPPPTNTALTTTVDQLPIVVVMRGPVAVASFGEQAKNALYRVRFVPLIMGLLACGGIIGLYFQPPGLQFIFRTFKLTPGAGTSKPIAVPVAASPKTASPAPVGRSVVGLGRLVPQGDVITVAPPFGAADGRIASIEVREGERVAKGALLARMDNEPALMAAVESARATVSSRDAVYNQTLATIRASRDETRATLERVQATASNAQREFDRFDQLYKKGYTSAAAFEQKRTVRDETAREVEKAKATLSRWEAVDPTQQPDAIVARRNIETAKADLARAERDLDKALVTAPIDGTVLTIHARPGEKPGSSGILSLGNIDIMVVEVEIYQTQIGIVSIGNPVTISAEALDEPLVGTVTRIGLEVGRQVLLDQNPAANTDARVVRVYVSLEPTSSKRAQRYTNLQVTARIAVQGEVR